MRSWVHVEDLLEDHVSIQQGGDLMEMLANIIIIIIMKQKHLYIVSHTLIRATGEEMF